MGLGPETDVPTGVSERRESARWREIALHFYNVRDRASESQARSADATLLSDTELGEDAAEDIIRIGDTDNIA